VNPNPVEIACDAHAQLGEGPVWDARTRRLVWLDILVGVVHELDPVTGTDTTTTLGMPIGALAPRARGGWILIAGDRFRVTDSGWQSVVVLGDMAPLKSRLLFNGGACDPAGRFFAGTLAYDSTPGAGVLYCVEPDATITLVLRGVTISNGLAWAPDGRTMYYIDSATGGIRLRAVRRGCGVSTFDARSRAWVACGQPSRGHCGHPSDRCCVGGRLLRADVRDKHECCWSGRVPVASHRRRATSHIPDRRQTEGKPMSTHIDELEAAVKRERSRTLDWSDKAVQPPWYGCSITEVAAARPKLDELSTPMMTLDRRALDENLATMTRWCAQAGLSQAPHGKTTMAPALWRDQLLAGCWAITVANEPQLRVARGAGVPRVILANLFLRPDGLAWLAGELAADPGFEFMCWVDSVQAVHIMDAALSAAGARRRVPVLIEVGHPRARTGVRSLGDALRVADAVTSAPTLALAGVAGFEGSVAHEINEKAIADVDAFLTQMLELHHTLLERYEVQEALLSAGGSAFFDRVAAILGPEGGLPGPARTRIVLRSGAYLVHDDGYYRMATPHTRGTGPEFRSAMHVWARVISMPEPGIAYLDAGKRDLPFDEGLPELQVMRRTSPDGATATHPLIDHEIFATSDQHAHVRVPAGSPLRVGDVVRLGLSHPCTAFDKWSLIPVVDNASAQTPVVVDLVRTYF